METDTRPQDSELAGVFMCRRKTLLIPFRLMNILTSLRVRQPYQNASGSRARQGYPSACCGTDSMGTGIGAPCHIPG